MSRYRRGGKNGKRDKQDRPSSTLHRQYSSGRLSHWYSHKPIVTVDQLHKYRRKEFSHIATGYEPPPPPQPPISLSASPSFITEYRCHYEPPYRTAEEMSVNRRHAAVPKDELQVEGEAEFSPEYADQYKDMPRERNVVGRQGSHIGPFVCANDADPEGLAFKSEQNDRYVPHPDGRRADNLRPGTGLRMDQAPMEGETEQTASYRKYPTTPHPDAAPDRNQVTPPPSPPPSKECARRPYDESMKEMILTRDSGMLLRPARSFAVIGGPRIERAGGGSHMRRPAFRLQVVDCSSGAAAADDCSSNSDGDGDGDDERTTTDAFVVLTKCSDRFRSPPSSAAVAAPKQQPSHHDHHFQHHHAVLDLGGGGGGGNRWVKRRQRKMGTVRFFDDVRDRLPAASVAAGKTIQ